MSVRIVAVADTHTFESDLGAIPDGDVFVHAGDMLRSGSLSELEGVAKWIRGLPHRHKLIVAGNHDWCFARTEERKVAIEMLGDATYLEDSGTVIEGVHFWGSPWQPAFHGWAFNLPRGAPLAERWALIPQTVNVLITHGPPEGIHDDPGHGGRGGRHERTGCADLRSRVVKLQPALHLFGHIHQDGGATLLGGTWFANVTTWECERDATTFDVTSVGDGHCQVDPVSVPL